MGDALDIERMLKKVEETLVCLFNIKRNHGGDEANFGGALEDW